MVQKKGSWTQAHWASCIKHVGFNSQLYWEQQIADIWHYDSDDTHPNESNYMTVHLYSNQTDAPNPELFSSLCCHQHFQIHMVIF